MLLIVPQLCICCQEREKMLQLHPVINVIAVHSDKAWYCMQNKPIRCTQILGCRQLFAHLPEWVKTYLFFWMQGYIGWNRIVI